MKMVHLNKTKKNPNAELHVATWMKKVSELEKAGHAEEAILEYNQIIEKYPLQEKAYDRLMILYRKAKQYKEEAKTISDAIHRFENRYGVPPATTDKKIMRLSKTLSQSLCLTDKKGTLLYDPGPLGRWEKRMATLKKLTQRKN